jgi:dTDP-4-dehydrorhamnose 3,5-epimerase
VKVRETAIPGVLVVEPAVHRDPRGFFLETWRDERYRSAGIDAVFVQDNQSRSSLGTLRGLHAQVARPQGKLVRVIEGEVFDVAVDIRPHSPTYGRWVGERLTADNFLQLWVPPGFAHGFCVLSEAAQVEYKCTAYYDRDDEIAIAWNDPDLAIAWPIGEPLVSARDRDAPRLRELRARLERHGRSPRRRGAHRG